MHSFTIALLKLVQKDLLLLDLGEIADYLKKFTPRVEESNDKNSSLLPNVELVIQEAYKLNITEERIQQLEVRYRAKHPERLNRAESEKSAPKNLAAVANQSSDLVQPFHQLDNGHHNKHGVINEHEDEYAEESDVEERKRGFDYADDGAELQDFNQ